MNVGQKNACPTGIHRETLGVKDTDLLTAALKLPPRKRERVAEALLQSIKLPSQKHLDRLWAQESESRIDGFLAGKIKTVSGEKVLKYRDKR